jgi:acyl carrier protein
MDPNVSRRVIELAAEHAGIEPDQVQPEHHFTYDLHFDSLSAVEFAMDLEDEFNIAVPDEQMQTMQTVRQAIAYVQRELARAIS